jgi:ribosomal protein S18 acetylase RimI-like enzyme
MSGARRATSAAEPYPAVRQAGPDDAPSVALLLYDFNREFDEPVPEPGALARRLRELIEDDAIVVLLAAGEGMVIMRLMPSLLSESLDCYLEEVYVVPARRRRGIGRALVEAALGHARERGAGHAYLGTGEDDLGAQALYERLGFSRRGGHESGPTNYFYEREL